MTNRRNFIKASGAIALGGLFLNKTFASNLLAKDLPDPGVQLFTFFNSIDNDVEGTLKKISELGYKNIESAFSRKGGYYGMTATEFSKFLNSIGLKWRSHHVLGAPFKLPPNAKPPVGADGKPIAIPKMRNLKENFQELVDEAAEGGVEYLVCANIPTTTVDEVKSAVETLNKTADAASNAGLKFAYHNHEWEFKQVGDKTPYEVFLAETDPKKLRFELDIAWALKGGADPIALFEKNPGRFPLWHIKDLDKDFKNIFPLGEGSIEYQKYFSQATKAGLEYYFIEHDMPQDAFGSVTTSIKNLKKIHP
jgi:sugar phosphate isomerase/epimerase